MVYGREGDDENEKWVGRDVWTVYDRRWGKGIQERKVLWCPGCHGSVGDVVCLSEGWKEAGLF